jgi:hypothetical protein
MVQHLRSEKQGGEVTFDDVHISQVADTFIRPQWFSC